MIDDKPGAPPSTETVKPKISGEEKPSFSFRELEFLDVMNVDGYKYISFMVRGEFIISIKEFEYYNYLSNIFEQLDLIKDEGGCTCDKCEPPFFVLEDDFKITAQMVDLHNKEILEEKDKYIKIYEVYDIIPFTQVGGICKTDDK